ncbi:MAG: HEAT repeat domain-containing protein [Blastocatellia bacterium]|nr:HEAT repeat domain-containing protein [Blastocatellia bacterium]
MKSSLRAVAFCSILLAALSGYLWQSAEAATEDIVLRMLALPAPPPPNPAVKIAGQGEAKYDRGKPPADNAATYELLEYWVQMSSSHGANQYSPEPSNAVLARLKKEVDKNPEKLLSLLNAFIKDDDGPAFVKGHYDREGTTGVYDRDDRSTIRSWLVSNSSYFTSELAREAEQVADTRDAYVSNQAPLLALTRHDFAKAKAILDRLYANDSSPVSQTLARWALYRNALNTNSLGEIERYRDELKAIVENKKLGDGMRDLAMDALVIEKEWSGRDDWYYSLMTDETLVKMDRFTGMTTLINQSPPDKYADKMIELLKSDNPSVRGSAIRNLSRKFDSGNVELIRALVPWLEDAKWAVDVAGTRARVVEALTNIIMPEAVPGLINLLDEKIKGRVPRYGTNAISDANYAGNMALGRPREEILDGYVPSTANAVKNAAASAANAAFSISGRSYVEEEVSLRMPAIRALVKQKDPRAIAVYEGSLMKSTDTSGQR